MEDRWLSLEEAADVLKVGVPTVQTLINRGLLAAETPAGSPSGQPQVAYAALLAFLRADQQTLRDEGHQPPDLGIIPRDDRPA